MLMPLLHHVTLHARNTLSILRMGDHTARMEPVEQPARKCHKQRIENVDPELLGLQLTILAEDVLCHAED